MSDAEYGIPEWHDLGNCEYPGCSKIADERLIFSDEFLWQAEMSLCNEHVEKQRNEFYKMGRDPNRYRNSKRYRLIFDYSSDVGHVPEQLIRKWFVFISSLSN